MKELQKLKYEIDLISKGEHNQEFTGVYQRLTELNQALQLLQPDVIACTCKRPLPITKCSENGINAYCTRCSKEYKP